jgi:hypothetical protein
MFSAANSKSERRRLTMARKRRRKSRSVHLVCAAILGALCLLYWLPAPKRLAHAEPYPDLAATANYGDRASVRPAALRVRPRSVYPYSVIPGGAYSVAELDSALRADPVAAAHYAVFNRAQMRLTAAPESAAVYVSYRQGNRIYWTRRKLHVAAEEALLTDGNHAARARCGNRISLTPQSPAGAVEPSPSDLDLPEPPPPVDPDATSDVPLLVHEIFPTLLATWQPGGVPGGTTGSPPYGGYGAGFPGALPGPGSGGGPAGGPSTSPNPGSPPLPPISSGGTLPPPELPTPELPPPNAPPPFSTEIPEPATAALLLCGALVASHLLSRRRLD